MRDYFEKFTTSVVFFDVLFFASPFACFKFLIIIACAKFFSRAFSTCVWNSVYLLHLLICFRSFGFSSFNIKENVDARGIQVHELIIFEHVFRNVQK